jgi:hypothetical protein
VQCFEHEPVAAKRHNDLGFFRCNGAIALAQLGQRRLRSLGIRGEKGDAGDAQDQPRRCSVGRNMERGIGRGFIRRLRSYGGARRDRYGGGR